MKTGQLLRWRTFDTCISPGNDARKLYRVVLQTMGRSCDQPVLYTARTSWQGGAEAPCCVDVHVGEAALALARNVDYEVPFLTRQAARVQQQLADLERKHTEHLRSAVQATREYCQASCDSLPHQKRPCPT